MPAAGLTVISGFRWGPNKNNTRISLLDLLSKMLVRHGASGVELSGFKAEALFFPACNLGKVAQSLHSCRLACPVQWCLLYRVEVGITWVSIIKSLGQGCVHDDWVTDSNDYLFFTTLAACPSCSWFPSLCLAFVHRPLTSAAISWSSHGPACRARWEYVIATCGPPSCYSGPLLGRLTHHHPLSSGSCGPTDLSDLGPLLGG